MNEKTEKYFGIEFPEEIALSSEVKHQLAKLLFISPSTGVSEVKSIINNSKLIKAVSKLIDTLNCEIELVDLTTSLSESEDSKGLNDKLFLKKFKSWQKEFGLPTIEEIKEVLTEKKIPVKGIWVEIFNKCKSNEFDTPAKHSDYLSEYIIGQAKAVKAMSVLMCEHKIQKDSELQMPKSSLLLIGNTGTGKSYLVNKAQRLLSVPLLRINCASLVPAGIVGTTVDKYLTTLYLSVNSNIDHAEHAMIHFDEIDKLSDRYHKTDDYKLSIQLEVLRFFDKNERLYFPDSHKQFSDMISIPTDNLILVFSGAFSGLDQIILDRIKKENNGKLNLIDKSNILQYCTTQDIIAFGIIPELAGRLSYISPLNSLGSKEIFNIINAKDSHYLQHLNKCKALGLNISFSEDALRILADKVADQNIGARGLNSVLNNLLSDFYFDYQKYAGKEIIIDKSMLDFLLTKQQYSLVINEFEAGTELTKIARKFNSEIDEILDVYLQWKKLERR